MTTRDFLRRVLGFEGYYCLFAAKSGTRKQKFYGGIDQLLEAALQFDENGYDTYFALATFAQDRNREADNALQMRAFFMDLDCGDSKPFQTQKEAIVALKQFVKWNNLPVPTLVNSGRGIHVYWALTEPVGVPEWRNAAERLKLLCKEQEFHADPAITADAARVLRMPGTHNYKDKPPNPVALMSLREPVSFAEFTSHLPEAPVLSTTQTMREMAENDPLLKQLMGNRSSSFKKIIQRTLKGEGCAQLAYVATNQASVDEPMWRAALSIAWHCEDKAKAIHMISKNHPQYDPDETVTKAAGTKGPYLCDKFDEYRPGGCDGCPLKGKIRSPISIGSFVPEGEPLQTVNGHTSEIIVDPDEEEGDSTLKVNGHTQTITSEIKYPNPYYRGLKGGVYRKERGEPDEDGNVEEKEIRIYHNDLYVVRRIIDPESGQNLVWRLHLPKDGVQEFTTPVASVTSREKFRECLSMEGVAAYGRELDGIMDYGRAWLHQLQYEAEADTAHRQFGWIGDDYESFVVGKNHIYPDRVEHNPSSVTTAGYKTAFDKSGTLKEWVDMMSFYNRPGMELHQFIIGCCAGAPLMAFTPIHGALLHLMSDGSGYGKTTTCLAGLSIWGNPDETISHEEDTVYARMLKAETFCNLPLVMDETTNMAPEQVSKLAYQITNGKQRDRMQSGGNQSRWRGKAWNTIFISTANASMFDKLTASKLGAQGESRRIMEFHVDKVVFSSKRETDEFANKVKRTFGHAGVPLVQSYMQNMEETRAGLIALQEQVDLRCNLKSDDRFYSAVTASALLGLQHLQHLGLVNYDLKALKEWVVSVFIPRCMGNLGDMDLTIQHIINEYINVDNYNAVLRIKSDEDIRSGVSGNIGMDQLAHVPDKQPGFRFLARYETDREYLYLVPTPLKKWCAERQISYQSVTNKLRDQYGAKQVSIRMNKGTRFNMPPTSAWEIKLNLDELGEKVAKDT